LFPEFQGRLSDGRPTCEPAFATDSGHLEVFAQTGRAEIDTGSLKGSTAQALLKMQRDG
jgi:hypothetical protein